MSVTPSAVGGRPWKSLASSITSMPNGFTRQIAAFDTPSSDPVDRVTSGAAIHRYLRATTMNFSGHRQRFRVWLAHSQWCPVAADPAGQPLYEVAASAAIAIAESFKGVAVGLRVPPPVVTGDDRDRSTRRGGCYARRQRAGHLPRGTPGLRRAVHRARRPHRSAQVRPRAQVLTDHETEQGPDQHGRALARVPDLARKGKVWGCPVGIQGWRASSQATRLRDQCVRGEGEIRWLRRGV